MSEDLKSLMSKYRESELSCSKSRKIYNELEHILIRQEYLQSEEYEVEKAASSSSIGNKNQTKVKSNFSLKSKAVMRKSSQSSSDIDNNFELAEKKIKEFEDNKGVLTQSQDKYCTQFLDLLEAQNTKLSKELIENDSDDC